MSDDANIDAYFERIGFSGSIAPTLQTLEQLHALHPAAIPYENLDPLMGVPVRLEQRNLEQKLLFEKRGGFCFEQNLLFKRMLEDLGYEVTGLGARVIWGRENETDNTTIRHMVMLVDINGSPYLADVGFGAVILTAPLRLRADVEQETPHLTFRLTGGEPDWTLEVRIGEDWRPVFVFDLTPRSFEDYVGFSDRAAGDPFFRENLLAGRVDKDRQSFLFNGELSIHPKGGEREIRKLGSVAEVRETLSGHFGISLPPAERLDSALERVLAGAPAA